MIKLLKFSFAFVLFTMIFVACSKEEISSTDADEFAEAATTDLQERSNTGHGGCFELVFPIEIKFADGSTATADSAGGIKAAIKTWKQANPDNKTRPSFVFPISVVKGDGTIVVIDDQDELKALWKECPRHFGKGHGKGMHCFKLNFPFTIKTANGTEVVITGPEDIKKMRGQKGQPRAQKPELKFPVSITLKDGEVKSVASKEELQAIKDACKG